MTKLLVRLFVKGYPDQAPDQLRGAVGSLSGIVGICCNLLLFAGKLLAGTLSGAVSITADALNNLSDASGSIVTLIGFRLADKPADIHHPYGHARAEYLSGLAVVALILFIGLELVKSSVDKILHPVPIDFTPLTAAILVASIGVKLWMTVFNTYLSKLIDSNALMATAADSRNDCITTSAVLAAGILEFAFRIPFDGWIGLCVAAFILYSGFGMAKQTSSPLLGENADPELQEKIVDYIRQQPRVLGYHDLMVHDYGPGQRYASLHVEMDYREDPMECHECIDRMERECLESHNVHLVIHHDPVVTDNLELQMLKQRTASLLRAYDPRLTLHDFRMVQGKRHMNLVFDVPLPTDLRHCGDQIRQIVEKALNTSDDELTYHVKITFDVER